MYFKLYLATFLANPEAPSDLQNTGELRQCFYNIFLESKESQIQNWLNGFQRAYTRTLRYFRALRVVDRVVEAVLNFRMSELCQRSLMRMTHCSHCAGYMDGPCNGMCQNTLRGCLMDLGELAEPMQDFSEALVAMESEARAYNVYNQVTFLSSYFFTLVRETTASFRDIVQEVRCVTGMQVY